MRKARIMLPILEKIGPVHLTDGWWSNPVRDDIPEEILTGYLSYNGYSRELFDEGYYKREYSTMNLTGGLEKVTDYKNVASKGKEEKWMWSINNKGRKLLEWFKE